VRRQFTPSDAPELIVGGLSESQQQVLRADRALDLLEAQLANLPPDCPEFTRRRAEALVRRAQEAAVAVGVAHMHATASAYARILHAEQLVVTAEAGQRRLQELQQLQAAQLDELWVKADMIERFVALGYPHEQPAPVLDSTVAAVDPSSTWPGLVPGPKHGPSDDLVLKEQITTVVRRHRDDHDDDEPAIADIARALKRHPKAFGKLLRERADTLLDPAVHWPPPAWWQRRARALLAEGID
jgi:hypothetical protein